MSSCELCRHEEATESLCKSCYAGYVVGPMKEAYQHWKLAKENYKRCCSGMHTEILFDSENSIIRQFSKDYLYFHSKYWEGEHKSTFVEYGVAFYRRGARTYFLRDFGGHADSEEYGEEIPYTNQEFWQLLEAQLERAPKEAWDSGLQSCFPCGRHYYETCPCQTEKGEDSP